MTPAWFSEIEPFPAAVLSHHYPDVVNLGDMTQIKDMLSLGILKAPDVLVGGTPCQAFSVAGARKGLSDERGQLTIEYVRLLDVLDTERRESGKPEAVCVWENVPGVLSSKDNAFGCFLGALAGEDDQLQPSGKRWSNAGCVYGPQRAVAWRVIDAQYFGLAQRRKRVFVVASARSGFDPTEVLFESEGVRRDIAPIRQTREEVASSSQICIAGNQQSDIAATLQTTCNDYPRADGFNFVISFHVNSQPAQMKFDEHIASTLTTSQYPGGVFADGTARKFMPIECARLQGFPDDHCRIPWRGKPADQCPDSPQYKAYGNTKAVPCVQWIGERLLRAIA